MEELDVYAPDSSEDEYGFVKIDHVLYTPYQARRLAARISKAADYADDARKYSANVRPQ